MKIRPLLLTCGALLVTSHSWSALNRTYTAGRYAIEINGLQAGLLKDVEEHVVSAEVVSEANAFTTLKQKQLAIPTTALTTIRFGFDIGKPVWDWMQAATARSYQRRNLSVLMLDNSDNALRAFEYQDALLTEIAFPALDATSKDAGYVTVKFAAPSTRDKSDSGLVKLPPATKQKTWSTSMFRLEIANVDTTRVSHVDPIVFSQKVQFDAKNNLTDFARTTSAITLGVVTSNAALQSFVEWSNKKDARSGIVHLTGVDGHDIATISLSGLVIGKITAVPTDKGDNIQRTHIDMTATGLDVRPASP